VEPGLKIAWVQCSSVACAQAGEGMEEAAKELGAEFKSWADKDTPTTVKAGMNSAMQWGPSMILTSSNDPAWYKSTLTEAEEKGIPVVTFALPGSYKQPGLVINYEPAEDLYFRGVLMTDYAIAQTHGEAHILYMTDSDYAVLEAMNEGVEQEVERVCPETCTVTTQASTSADLESGKNVAETVDLVRRNPETNFIIASFGGFISSQLYSALSSAGVETIPSVSQASTAQNYELINSGGGQVADVGLPLPYLGYLSIDAGLRALAGQGPQVVTIKRPYMEIEGHPEMGKAFPPTQILEKGAIKDPNEPWTPIQGFQQQFYKLWGVS
jgi:ABC-type sugar transport system substrate-binding protein